MIKCKKMMNKAGIVLMVLTSLVLAAFSVQAEPQGDLIIFHAGSLAVPFEEMEKQFEAKYPGVDVLREGGGSTNLARMISEVGKPADIMASADYIVIDKILVPDYAAWNVRFATNQLVLCYTDQSEYASELTVDNWYDILAREGVVWGHSDPNLDPCGYRSLMVLQLAEKHYNIPGLYDKIIANRPQENIRTKSVDLVSLLKTGNMDYAWEYQSVAVQHDLKYLVLPDQINLGNYEYDDFYKHAVVEVTGSEPGAKIQQIGQSVTYGVTMLQEAPNPEAAVAFLQFLMDPEGGLKILKDQGQPPFIPCRVPTQEMKAGLPEALQALVEVK